jgi:hypothetical protein
MTRSRAFALAAALGLILADPGSAPAQDKIYRSLDAQPGQTLRLAVYGNVSKDCTPGPLPEVKVLAPPRNGSLAVRSGKTKAGALSRCPNLEVPIQGIFYEAKANYSGADEVAYEVRRADRPVQSFTVRITVGARAKPKPGAKETTDL